MDFGEGITEICHQAFQNYSNLREVAFPDSLRSIEQFAFMGTNLTHVRLPDGVAFVGMGAFSRTPLWDASEGDIYLDGWLLSIKETKLAECRVRPGTMGISPHIFSFDTTIDALYIPGTVKYIGSLTLATIKRLYLGRGCPNVNRNDFPFYCRPEIIRTDSVIPWENAGVSIDTNNQDNLKPNGQNPAKTRADAPLYCRKCGTRLLSDSLYCHKCGTKVEFPR